MKVIKVTLPLSSYVTADNLWHTSNHIKSSYTISLSLILCCQGISNKKVQHFSAHLQDVSPEWSKHRQHCIGLGLHTWTLGQAAWGWIPASLLTLWSEPVTSVSSFKL